MAKLGGVYEIINIKNDKKYVGSSVYIKGRWSNHKSSLRRNKHGNNHLQNAWNKYGKQVFKFNVLVYCEPEEGLKIENALLATGNYEYNIAMDAKAPTLGMTGKLAPWYGKKFTEEHRNKIGESHMGKKHTKETIQKMKDRVFTKEHRRKIGEATRKRIVTEETKQKMSDNHWDSSGKNNPNYGKVGELSYWYGRKHTEETKRKMSETASDGRNAGENNPMWGKKASAKTLEKMSKAMSGSNNPGWINLSKEELGEMKKLREQGYSYKELGEVFRVSHGTVWNRLNTKKACRSKNT